MSPEELQQALADMKQRRAGMDNIQGAGMDAVIAKYQSMADQYAQANPGDTGYKPFDYGGHQGLADSEANHYRQMANSYGSRQAPTTDYTLANQDRGQQQSALGLQQSAAMGQAPSVAAIQQQQGLNQAMGMNQSMAASARGGGNSQALAARSALANNADMQQGAVNSAAMLRAQEMAQARGDYMSGAMGMGAQDMGRAQYESTLAQNQMFGNDKAQMAAEGLRGNVFSQVNQGNNAEQDRIAGNINQGNAVNSGVAANNATAQAAEDQRHAQRTGDALTAGAKGLAPAFEQGGVFGTKKPAMGQVVDPRQSPNDKIGPGY